MIERDFFLRVFRIFVILFSIVHSISSFLSADNKIADLTKVTVISIKNRKKLGYAIF